MKVGVVTFPGSNCDYDSYALVRHVMDEKVEFLWHKSTDLQNCELIILPGGFSYGDYLRSGAIARFSPIMESVIKFANSGGLVLGICNGFQMLTECGLLPGALIRNDSIRFRSQNVYLKVEETSSAFTNAYGSDAVIKMPIAHGDGNYYSIGEELKQLEDNGRVLFRYCDKEGNLTSESNPNGSVNNIAGIVNMERNVLGMMPHPERAAEKILGSVDGLKVFESARAALSTLTAAGKA